MRLPLVLAALTVLLAAGCSEAASPPAPPASPGAGLEAGSGGVVASVIDGNTLKLATGVTVRLVGLLAPAGPPFLGDTASWPLADAGRRKLAELTRGRTVHLWYGGRHKDRYGHLLAQVVGDNGLWIQGAMLKAGLARVETFADNRALADKMLVLESQARRAGLGLWANAAYRVRDIAGLDRDTDSFQLVEGQALSVAHRGRRTYINFGDDYRTDFTLTIPDSARRSFVAAAMEPEILAGLHMRVRGWVDKFNGPMITVTHPEQIEILE